MEPFLHARKTSLDLEASEVLLLLAEAKCMMGNASDANLIKWAESAHTWALGGRTWTQSSRWGQGLLKTQENELFHFSSPACRFAEVAKEPPALQENQSSTEQPSSRHH